MSPSSAEDTGKCYKQPLFGPFAPSGSLESNGTARYGTYESFGPGTLSTEHAVRDEDPYKGYSETYSASWATGWNRPCLVSSRRSRYPFADKSRESQYTAANPSDSFSLCSPSRSRPAPIGSRGRDMHQNMQGNCCERGAVGSEDRQKAVTCSSQSPAFRIKTLLNYSNSAASVFQRPKRKMMEPVTLCKLAKKRRTVGAAPSLSRGVGPNISKDNCISPDNQEKDGQRVCVKKARASEKRRRRREKNNEKYGDKHRWAFTCAFCKFHTFEDKDIEKHFGSTYHREILDYIRRQAKFDDNVIRFLHDCMVHKFRKTVSTLHKLKSTCGRSKDEWTKIMEGVTEDDYMRRMEVVYCSACDTQIPLVFSSVQQHLCSLTHLKRKEAYKDQLKRDSVVTAKAIINNDNVKMRFEMYMKGEDPFSANLKDTSSDCLDQERFDEAEDEEADDDDSQEHERSDEAEDDDSQDQERSDDEAGVTDS